jgi:prepilin-type N-terminal cleavage/methylation domain-containing protein
MKTSSARARRGFTLVELLVVIAIISVLAAAGFAAANGAMTKAKKTSAGATAISLQEAIKQFTNTYGYLPEVGNSGGAMDVQITTDNSDGQQLLRILLGKENPGGGGANATVQNTRGINFLEVKEAKENVKRDGLLYGSDKTSITGLYDPFGNPFVVVLDTDYNDTIEFNLGGPVKLNGRKVAVYSAGSDRKPGTKEDIKTWQ